MRLGQRWMFPLVSQHFGDPLLCLSRRLHARRRLENLRRFHNFLMDKFLFYYLTKLKSLNNNSNKSISDIDECDYDPDNDQDRLCPGLCRNTIGSYICIDEDEEIEEFEVTCQPGFEANNNGQCLGLFDIQFNRFIQCCDTLFFFFFL